MSFYPQISLKTRKIVTSHGPPTAGKSWFVHYSFYRPLPPGAKLKKALNAALANFKSQPSPGPVRLKFGDGFRIEIIRASKIFPTFFVLGGGIDLDSGGFVLAEMRRNLFFCVTEKTKKVAAVRDKYPEWWLVLVDRIGYGLDQSEREELRELILIREQWDRIILVNPLDPGDGFDL